MGAWRGTSNTVSRALTLIEAGALDEGDVDALAGRLGVGERHLRRLFRQHLGAAPVSVAQTRRVLLAKALIHQTDLSMAEVALASGFGSVRRFNETFQALYGRPPSALRRRCERLRAGGVRLSLPYRPPYDGDLPERLPLVIRAESAHLSDCSLDTQHTDGAMPWSALLFSVPFFVYSNYCDLPVR
jgi:AraC family transcriptional regulator of adaptative response / DNA-3-methyladenine glycosylase II